LEKNDGMTPAHPTCLLLMLILLLKGLFLLTLNSLQLKPSA
jgi:hypothetical protein